MYEIIFRTSAGMPTSSIVGDAFKAKLIEYIFGYEIVEMIPITEEGEKND